MCIRDSAAPHPNGYRALQTYTIWPQPSEFTSDDLPTRRWPWSNNTCERTG